MIVDSVLYAGEADMLELRLRTLDPAVDRFFICEADITHQGDDRQIVRPDRDPRFAPWWPKIQPVVAELPRAYEESDLNGVCVQCPHILRAHSSTTGCGILTDAGYCPCGRNLTPVRAVAPQRLGVHRSNLTRVVADRVVPADAIVLVGDIDEIPDPVVVDALAAAALAADGRAVARMSYRFLSVDRIHPDEVCFGTTAMVAAEFDPLDAREHPEDSAPVDGGFHFSWVGSYEERTARVTMNAYTVDLVVDPNACYEAGVAFDDTPLESSTVPDMVETYLAEPSAASPPDEWMAP